MKTKIKKVKPLDKDQLEKYLDDNLSHQEREKIKALIYERWNYVMHFCCKDEVKWWDFRDEDDIVFACKGYPFEDIDGEFNMAFPWNEYGHYPAEWLWKNFETVVFRKCRTK